MGFRHEWDRDDAQGEKMTVRNTAGLKRGVAFSRKAPQRVRLERTNSDVQHNLLLPAGLADGLGLEVACPTA